MYGTTYDHNTTPPKMRKMTEDETQAVGSQTKTLLDAMNKNVIKINKELSDILQIE